MRPLPRVAVVTIAALASAIAVAQPPQPATGPQPPAPQADDVQSGTLGKAGDNQEAPKTPDALFGDWWGVRSRLDDAGLKLGIGYKGEAAANVSGGRRKDATETGQFAFTGALDTGKAFGLDGGTVQATITYRQGHDLGAVAGLGTLQQV